MALTTLVHSPTLPQLSNSSILDSLLILSIFVPFIFLATYLVTAVRFHLTPLPNSKDGAKRLPSPPTLPYHLPYLGSAFSMATNAHTFYQYLYRRSLSSHHPIIGVRTGPLYSYFTTGSSNILTMFKNSRVMSTEEIFLEVNRSVGGLGSRDVKVFNDDESGPFAKPWDFLSHDGKGKEGAPRIWRAVHEAHMSVQSGKSLRALSEVFAKEFEWVLDSYDKEVIARRKDDWDTTSLYYGLFRNLMSTASTRALMGTKIFDYEPNVVTDFWEWFNGFLPLFFGMPRLFYPKVYAAKDRLDDGFIKMLKELEGRYEVVRTCDEPWIEDLGSRINRLRDEAHIDAGISLKGRAQLMVIFMIA